MNDLIGAHIAHMRAAGLSDNTINDRYDLLRRLDEDLPCGLAGMTREDLNDWLARGRNGRRWSRNTLHIYGYHIREFCLWRAGYTGDNPAADLPRVRRSRGVPRPATAEQVAHILDRAEEPWRLFAVLARYGGLRCIEISRLDVDHIEPAMIRVVGKGDKEALVPNHDKIREAVRDLPPGPVARLQDGSRASAADVSHGFRHYTRRQLRMPRMGLHRLRSSYATELLRAGAHIRVVQRCMRHASLETTAVYLDVEPGEMVAAVNRLT